MDPEVDLPGSWTWDWEGRSLLAASSLAGVTLRSQGRTITDSDFSEITNLTWTISEIHTNESKCRDGIFGTRVLAGACILAFGLGLATLTINPELHQRNIRLLALAGYEDVRFRSPLMPGTTIYVETSASELVGTSTRNRAIISFSESIITDEGAVLADFVRKALCQVPAPT